MSGDKTAYTLVLDTRWRWVTSFTLRSALLSRYLLGKTLGGLQTHFERDGEEKIPWESNAIHPARSRLLYEQSSLDVNIQDSATI